MAAGRGWARTQGPRADPEGGPWEGRGRGAEGPGAGQGGGQGPAGATDAEQLSPVAPSAQRPAPRARREVLMACGFFRRGRW